MYLHEPLFVAQLSVVHERLSLHEAAPQHVESTQLPVPQSVPAPHACPAGSLSPQRLSTFRQSSGETQSALDPQVVRHDGLLLLHW